MSDRRTFVRMVGSGGMAEVWKARVHGPAGFEKTIAIKRILAPIQHEPRFRSLFVNEANLVARLQHPNIVQVYDFGILEEDNGYFIGMEYVPGHTLSELLRRVGKVGERLPTDVATFVGLEAAEALAYAHALPIIHDDISPQNILLSYSGRVKVTDFGLAKSQRAIRGVAKLVGKVGYMSPERVALTGHDQRSDVFALGVVLYEMFTGDSLFGTGPSNTVVNAIRSFDVKDLDLLDTLPPEISSILAIALNPKPELRYPDAGPLAADLAARLTSEQRRQASHDLGALLQKSFSRDYKTEVEEERFRQRREPEEPAPERDGGQSFREPQTGMVDASAMPRYFSDEAATGPYRVLVVDDDPLALRMAERVFDEDEHLFTASSGDAAQAILLDREIDVVVSDQRMPGLSGLEFLAVARDVQPDAVRILLTGYPNLNQVLEALNDGLLYKFMVKPWAPEEMRVSVRRAAEAKRLAETTRIHSRRLEAELDERIVREKVDLVGELCRYIGERLKDETTRPRVLDTVRELSRLSAADPGNAHDEVSLEDCVRRAVESAGVEAEMVFEETATIRGRDAGITEAITQLLVNAKEAATPPPPISVRTWIEQGLFHVTVADRGPGVAEDIRRRMFMPFVTTREGRLGLGLPLARVLTEESHGTLYYEPNQGGSSFTLLFKL